MEPMNNPNLSLGVTVYGKVEQISDTISKSRVRIFYKGLNRNRTFISDNFAQQLINSLPCSPIKGIYSYEDVDYEDHGEKNTDGRIYGIVAPEPNFAWEPHIDKDGVERLYACADVLLYTALYPEASLIVGKSQSMEIYGETMEGEWKIWEDGKPYFYFSKGCLLGLQILGNTVEPCFEGAAFYTLCQELAKNIADYNLKISTKKEGKPQMDKNIFRLSDGEKAELIWDALNSKGGEYYCITEIYDDYALCINVDNHSYERVYYTKDEDSVILGERIPVKVVDITEAEYNALEAMKAAGSFAEFKENADAAVAELAEFKASLEEVTAQLTSATEENTAFKMQIEELTAAKETYEAEVTEKYSQFETTIEQFKTENARLEQEKSDIINEKQELSEFKKQIENEKKISILDDFVESLSESKVEEFKSTIDNYSISDFKKEVCAAAYEENPNLFSKKDCEIDLIPKNTTVDFTEYTGVEKLIEKHRNGGNK